MRSPVNRIEINLYDALFAPKSLNEKGKIGFRDLSP
jgi:hypothetical protein